MTVQGLWNRTAKSLLIYVFFNFSALDDATQAQLIPIMKFSFESIIVGSVSIQFIFNLNGQVRLQSQPERSLRTE